MTQREKITVRQAQAIETKKRILDTAREMIQEKGIDNITIRGIGKKAGVSVGSFYYYFKSKNDILLDIFHDADDYFSNRLSQSSSKHAADQIVEFYALYAKYSYIGGDINFAKKFYHTENKSFINKDRIMYQILVSMIQTGQDENEIIHTSTAEQIADYLFIAARGLVFDWCLYDGTYDLERAMVDYFTRLVPIFKQ